ncbi:MAG: cardiolipin synthase [Lachnospiraceae bacterium]
MSSELVSKEAGIRLLKQGKRGLFHMVFSRMGVIVLMLVTQVFAFFWMLQVFQEYLPHIYGGMAVLTALLVLYLINTASNPTVKISWLILLMIVPVFGVLMYVYTKMDLGHRVLKARVHYLVRESVRLIPENVTVQRMLGGECAELANLAHYIRSTGYSSAYQRTEVTYFASGEEKFPRLLEELERAKHFIFLEYFIIREGLMWGEVLEILARKAKQGVEVRVMYDGTCEFSMLPHDYPKRLKQLGISCKMFEPLRPFLSTHYNYRDHRKIVVIDGHTAFTGGINLADEYINREERFGYWKDTAIMLKGDAVPEFTLMFLQLWSVSEKTCDFIKYLSYPTLPPENTKGFVIPYGDIPLDSHKVGKMVYMDLLNHAQRYIYIMTPYLILDGEMETALRFAAERGVDVRLILPGIPDKKTAYALAKTHYASLLSAGVRLYEFTPGFVHAKVFVSDDKKAVVGTINLDYRSLYHHFECAAYLYDMPVIEEIKEDVERTLRQCRTVTWETIRREPWYVKLAGRLLKVIAPLM